MSDAMGREAKGDELLAAISSDFRVALPASCYMESFSAFEDEQKRNKRNKHDIDRLINQVGRDIISANAAEMPQHLFLARVANDKLFNDIEIRLFSFVQKTARGIDQIPAASDIILTSVSNRLIPDPTDNLILHSILADAQTRRADTRALLTDNTRDFAKSDVLTALNAVGIDKRFSNVTDALGWLGSLPR